VRFDQDNKPPPVLEAALARMSCAGGCSGAGQGDGKGGAMCLIELKKRPGA
jgi:hypothetical protein